MDKAMISGDVDIALGAGTSMAFRLKGVPNIAVAMMSGPPADFVLVVSPDGPIKGRRPQGQVGRRHVRGFLDILFCQGAGTG